jgi:hypothetical protein
MARSQRGASGVFVVIVLLLAMAAIGAVIMFQRGTDQVANVNETRTKLGLAATAVEQYTSTATRLPCPADPTLDTGDEVPPVAGKCGNNTGTIPWRTIGMRREDSLDAWGRKLSFRVYNPNAGGGSLVQLNGASMVNCYPDTAAGGGTDGTGLCKADHSTSSSDFLAGKGLSLTDFGTAHNDTAFVIISHGATGLGGYTVAGVQMAAPSGDEKSNTKATGPFFIDPFSGPDVGAGAPAFFDDLLVYRSIADLAAHANLTARNWPAPQTAAATLNSATIVAATGKAIPVSGDTGQSTIDLSSNGLGIGAKIEGFSGSNSNTNLSYDTTNGNPGIGVVGNGTNLLSSTGSEYVRIELSTTSRMLGVTFNDFGTRSISGITYTEQVQLVFKSGGSTVLTVTKPACKVDGGLSSFSIRAPGDFDSVEIHPLDATPPATPTQATQLAISSFAACLSGGVCTTPQMTTANTCP